MVAKMITVALTTTVVATLVVVQHSKLWLLFNMLIKLKH